MLIQQWLLARPGVPRVPADPGHGRLPGAVDGPRRRDEEAAGLDRHVGPVLPRPRACSASSSCCPSASATGATSPTASRRRTGRGTGARRCSGTSTHTRPVTGVDLSADMADVRQAEQARARAAAARLPPAAAAGRAAAGQAAPRTQARRAAARTAGAEPMRRATHDARLHLGALPRPPAPQPVAHGLGGDCRAACRRRCASRRRRRKSPAAGGAPGRRAQRRSPRRPCICSGICSRCSAVTARGDPRRRARVPDRPLGRRAAASTRRSRRHASPPRLTARRASSGSACRGPAAARASPTATAPDAAGHAAPRVPRGRARAGGILVVEDTQALGVLGRPPGRSVRPWRRRVAAMARHRSAARRRGVAGQGLRRPAGWARRRRRTRRPV